MADIKHGERLINTDDPAALEALRHRPSHSTGARRHIENLFVALQSEHFSQFLGQIGADLRGSAIELCRVLRIMEMSFVPVAVAMPVFVIVSMLMVVNMFVTVVMSVLVIVIMSVVMFVAVLVLVIMLVAVLVMLMFVGVFVIVLMFVFVFFAHCFAIPSQI